MKLGARFWRAAALVFFAAGGAAGLTSSANGAVILITYSGYVYNSSNSSAGVGDAPFGNGSIELKPFTAIYTLNFPVFGAIFSDDGVQSSISTGATHIAPVSATLTINSVTLILGNNDSAYARRRNSNTMGSNGVDYLQHGTSGSASFGGGDGSSSSIYNDVFSLSHDFVPNTDFTTALDFSSSASDPGSGHFDYSYSAAGHAILQFASGDLHNERVVVSVLAVPEPASWAMVIAGLGLVGANLRRRSSMRALT